MSFIQSFFAGMAVNMPLKRHVSIWSDSMQTVYMNTVMDSQGQPQICGLFSCSTASALNTASISLL